MITNADITLYNAYYSKEEGITKYNKSYLKGVNFQSTKSIKLSETKGLLSSDVVKIFIPFSVDSDGKRYIQPKAYKRLNDDEKHRYFTFNNDDKVVKGIIDFEITGVKPNNLKYLEEMYDDVYNIISVNTNDNGSPSMQHWEVGAK